MKKIIIRKKDIFLEELKIPKPTSKAKKIVEDLFEKEKRRKKK